MKKFVTTLILIVTFSFYVYYERSAVTNPTSTTLLPGSTDTQTTGSDDDTNSAPVESTNPGATPTPTPTPTPVTQGKYKNGSYTGEVADAFYGPVQVQVTVSGGNITDVKFLQFPTEQGESRQVSSRATPILRSEAISAQSANVDTVSGATQTSQAFVQSLSSALTQAS